MILAVKDGHHDIITIESLKMSDADTIELDAVEAFCAHQIGM